MKNFIGLQGVSPVWQDTPASYFWVSKSHCVYSLELIDGLPEPRSNGEFFDFQMLVRAFPFRNSSLYNGFSEIEKDAINGPLFDGSNTPRIECLEKLDKNLFIISGIEWFCAKDGSWNIFALNALESSVTRYGFSLDATPSSNPQEGNSILREIPSWKLSMPLFEILNSLYSLYSKQKPQRVKLTSEPGFEYVLTSSKGVEIFENKSAQSLNLATLFCSETDSKSNTFDSLFYEQTTTSDSGHVVFDWMSNSTNTNPQGLDVPFCENLVGENWWTISDLKLESRMTCPCGCNHD